MTSAIMIKMMQRVCNQKFITEVFDSNKRHVLLYEDHLSDNLSFCNGAPSAVDGVTGPG